MDNFYLSALLREATPEAQGRMVSRVSMEDSTLIIDLRLSSGRQLVVSVDRATPAFYLSIEPAIRSRSRKSGSTFLLSLLRKHVVDAKLVRLWKEPMDRIIHLDFEKLDTADDTVGTSLRLELTGRSANVYLMDAQGQVMGALFEHHAAERTPRPQSSRGTFDPANLAPENNDSLTQADMLERYFGADSPFGPQLRNEFLARCEGSSPSAAFRSLIDDLFNREPRPQLYSRAPLEEIGQIVINPRTDLLLSHIDLAQARGMMRYRFSSLSEAADEYYAARTRASALLARYSALKQTLAREINKRDSAIRALNADRARFEQPDRLKRFGDLILANLANARVNGATVTVVDYYDPDQKQIQIVIPEGASLKEAASDYFARYQKARRALASIAARERAVSQNLEPMKQLLLRLEQEPTAACIAEVARAADQLFGTRKVAGPDKGDRAKGKGVNVPGRKFRSSDGYEIVVGRNDRDNDALTFRIARPHDIWLHAADYPGSHAIIRNPSREAPPHRTIAEAAELAAFYSQAKREGKAAVHYAQKKFVSKPPRSKPGLVRLSSFKTILVEPRCDLERLG